MKINELIDLIQRKINSFIFRFILIAYSITLLYTHTDIFPRYVYVLGIIVYYIFYLFLLQKQRLRLFNDFAFIVLMVLGKNPNEAFIFIFILLPIINSINFSGRKKSPILYFITIFTYLGLLCYYQHKIELSIVYSSLLPLSSLGFLWVIEYYTSLRVKIRDFREKLNEVVDAFYTNKDFIKKPHKIYSELIKLINTRIKKDLISDLFCFTIVPNSEDKIAIINGSRFIWRYKIEQKDFLKGFEKRSYQLNIDLQIEDKSEPTNLALKVDIEGFSYIFIFVTNKTIPIYYILIGFFRTLVPSLSKMAKILLSEKRLQDIRNEELQRLSVRSQYVTRATKTMHFIRNRLGPVNNLLKMLDNRETVTPDKLQDFDGLIWKEKDRARHELDSIISRANYLLEKSNNPFNFVETVEVSLEKLFSILSRVLNIYFPNTRIKIVLPEVITRALVKLNLEGFELFLSDWLNNINKYYAGVLRIEFIVGEEHVSISFWNNYKGESAEIDQIVADLMSDDRNEIMKRTTHGLFQIKTSLEEMNIGYKIERIKDEVDFLKLTIDLKLIKHEDSNI